MVHDGVFFLFLFFFLGMVVDFFLFLFTNAGLHERPASEADGARIRLCHTPGLGLSLRLRPCDPQVSSGMARRLSCPVLRSGE